MEEIKRRFINSVAAQLSAAPRSTAKDELVEELSDNLYHRFLDMTGAGMDDEAAFARAMEDLGDVDELLNYLGVEPKDDVTIGRKEGQTRITTKNGQTVVNNNGGSSRRTAAGWVEEADAAREEYEAVKEEIDAAREEYKAAQEEADAAQEEADGAQEEADDAQDEADDAQEEADAAQERADAAQETEEADDAQDEADAAQARADAAQVEADAAQTRADAAQARADAAQARADAARKRAEERDRHDRDSHFPQSDLDSLLAGVSEACNTAIDQAKTALRQAKAAIQRHTTVQRDGGHVKVHFNSRPEETASPTPPEPVKSPEDSQQPTAQASDGWEFEAELNTDEGRFFAGAGPKQKKDVVYGFGYDKARGGFFSQWGEYRGGAQDSGAQGPRFTGEDATMEGNDDGSYSVTALKDLRGIEVTTVAGDVSIHLSEAPDAGVIIDGDVDELDVTCSADGVLIIREGRTASSSFFSRRGFCSADVELYLPRRHWEMLCVNTASGDVDIDRDGLDVDQLSVSTMSGDLNAHLRACTQLYFKSASGDIDLNLDGRCAELRAETMSGDINLRGQVEHAFLKSASGDIELEGLAKQFFASTASGDVRLKTAVLPQAMELSSKSGDVQACIPDEGPFSVRTKTVSGGMRSDFPIHYDSGTAVYGDGSGPVYTMTTISGDVSLRRS